MNIRSLAKNLWFAFLSQGVALVCSVLTTLLVPKIMGVEDYGYWQYFVFLVSYVSFFQLGVNDGVYLTHGGETRSEIDKHLVKTEFGLSLAMQALFMFAIVALSFVFARDSDKFILYIGAALYMVVSNATFFLGYVFQSMNETKLYSMSIVVDRFVFLVPLAACVLLRISDCGIYIAAYIVARCVALAYCLYNARDFLVSASVTLDSGLQALFRDMRLGLVMTVANVCGMLILGLARYIIEARWGIAVFGQLSLSLSLVNFILMFISQLSMVLFPALRQTDSAELGGLYAMLRNYALILLPLAFAIYYPASLFVSAWLPEYLGSLVYFVFLMPIVLFESLGDMICNTFFKVRCEPVRILAVNVISLAFAGIGVYVAAYVLVDIYAVMVAAVAALAIRAYLGMFLLSASYGEHNARICTSSLVFAIMFVAVNNQLKMVEAFVVTLALMGVYCAYNKKETRAFFGKCVEVLRSIMRSRRVAI